MVEPAAKNLESQRNVQYVKSVLSQLTAWKDFIEKNNINLKAQLLDWSTICLGALLVGK